MKTVSYQTKKEKCSRITNQKKLFRKSLFQQAAIVAAFDWDPALRALASDTLRHRKKRVFVRAVWHGWIVRTFHGEVKQKTENDTGEVFPIFPPTCKFGCLKNASTDDMDQIRNIKKHTTSKKGQNIKHNQANHFCI